MLLFSNLYDHQTKAIQANRRRSLQGLGDETLASAEEAATLVDSDQSMISSETVPDLREYEEDGPIKPPSKRGDSHRGGKGRKKNRLRGKTGGYGGRDSGNSSSLHHDGLAAEQRLLEEKDRLEHEAEIAKQKRWVAALFHRGRVFLTATVSK